MRIRLTSEDVIITDQLRTYVEYRLFTSIARYQALIGEVNVTLEHNRGNRGRFLCVITVDLRADEPIKVRAYGAHPNAAVDRAADRMLLRLNRRSSQDVSS